MSESKFLQQACGGKLAARAVADYQFYEAVMSGRVKLPEPREEQRKYGQRANTLLFLLAPSQKPFLRRRLVALDVDLLCVGLHF